MPAKATSRKAPCNSYECKSADKASNKTSIRAIEPARKVVNNRNNINDPEGMLEEEKNCPSSRFNTNGQRQGFGSWYNRPHHDHSFAEMTAEIGHKDHVCTCGMIADEQVEYR